MESRLNVGPSPGSCLESPVDRGAWRATVQGVTQSQAQVTEQRAAHPQETRAPEEKFKQMQNVFWVTRQPPKEGWCLIWG